MTDLTCTKSWAVMITDSSIQPIFMPILGLINVQPTNGRAALKSFVFKREHMGVITIAPDPNRRTQYVDIAIYAIVIGAGCLDGNDSGFGGRHDFTPIVDYRPYDWWEIVERLKQKGYGKVTTDHIASVIFRGDVTVTECLSFVELMGQTCVYKEQHCAKLQPADEHVSLNERYLATVSCTERRLALTQAMQVGRTEALHRTKKPDHFGGIKPVSRTGILPIQGRRY